MNNFRKAMTKIGFIVIVINLFSSILNYVIYEITNGHTNLLLSVFSLILAIIIYTTVFYNVMILKKTIKKIKNCPFCGSEAYYIEEPKPSTMFSVGCKNINCNAEIKYYKGKNYSKQKLIQKWNRRIIK